MPKTKRTWQPLEWDHKDAANKFQVDGGVSGVVVEVNGASEASPSNGTYWIQFWDGDPDDGGDFITSIPIVHENGTQTPITSGRFTDIGVWASDIWVNVSTDPF